MKDADLRALTTDFAQLILEAAYEATLAAALHYAHETGNNRVYLTLLGGGAFGNPDQWIVNAIRQALLAYQDADLNVMIVSHRGSKPHVQALVDQLMREISPA